ncbi:O-linked GlcNAc transferase [hydrothermal vent metagenome]|uniref:O-linked GlcNAc transferase n=1 Tax=hydrothermal vent metagenome TaxID=652676 RepID=A0A1W1D0D4_9ZZZZ
MTTFQLLLFIIAGGIFYLFFKQLFSGNHPKRGLDFKATVEDEQIGGINRPDKTFSRPEIQPTRMEELLTMADKAIERKDYDEANKALGSALIIDAKDVNALQKMGFLSMQMENFIEAKDAYAQLIALDANDDMAHALLANALHRLKEDSKAEVHHKKSISLDDTYAPHYFNYANTLYDLKRYDEALVNYKASYALDNTLSVAKEMIDELESSEDV